MPSFGKCLQLVRSSYCRLDFENSVEVQEFNILLSTHDYNMLKDYQFFAQWCQKWLPIPALIVTLSMLWECQIKQWYIYELMNLKSLNYEPLVSEESITWSTFKYNSYLTFKVLTFFCIYTPTDHICHTKFMFFCRAQSLPTPSWSFLKRNKASLNAN